MEWGRRGKVLSEASDGRGRSHTEDTETQRLVVHRVELALDRRAQRRGVGSEESERCCRRLGKASHRGHRDTEGRSSQRASRRSQEGTETWSGDGGERGEAELSEGRREGLTQRTQRHRGS